MINFSTVFTDTETRDKGLALSKEIFSVSVAHMGRISQRFFSQALLSAPEVGSVEINGVLARR